MQNMPIIPSDKTHPTNMSSSTFESRFIMWLWMVVLSIYTILTPSLTDLDITDTVFAASFVGLAIWSFGVWVSDGAGVSKKKMKSAIRSALLDNDRINNTSRDGRWNKPPHVHMGVELAALGAVIFATTTVMRDMAHYFEHNATLDNVIRDHPILTNLTLVFCTIVLLYTIFTLAPQAFKQFRAPHDYKKPQRIMNKTTPVVSSADGAFFQVTPTTADVVNALFGLPLFPVLGYILVILITGGDIQAFFKENTFIMASLMITGMIWAHLMSPSSKYDLDCIYKKIKRAERNVAEVSTMTDPGTPETQTATPATQCCGSCKGTGKVDSIDRDGKTIDFDGETFIVGNDPVGQGLA
ncbi:MAG: hypothetical protein Q9192_007368 [Flavoplaca navasiana]